MTAAATAPATHRGSGGYRFGQVARLEWIKLTSQRYPKWILAVRMVGMVGIAVLTGHFAPKNPGQGYDPVNNSLAGLALAQLVIGVLGVLVVTSEYSSGLIRNTLAAVPNRRLVLTAKAAVLTTVALVLGEISAFASYAAMRLSLPAGLQHPGLAHPGLAHPGLGQPGVLRAVILAGVYLGLVSLMGIGLGAIIRNSAGAIGALAAALLGLPLILIALPASLGHPVLKFTPMIIAENSLTAVGNSNEVALPVWGGLVMLGLYAAVAIGAGGWLLARRDA
jgi:hypothetical protein